jgi:hypothetical protein
MSYYPSPEARRERVRKTLKRWEEKFPAAMVRHMVEDAHKYEHSPYKREVYAAWIKDHEVRDDYEELLSVESFFHIGPPNTTWATPEENVQDFKALLQAPPDLPTAEEEMPLQGDEFPIPEVVYTVNKPSASLVAEELKELSRNIPDHERDQNPSIPPGW